MPAAAVVAPLVAQGVTAYMQDRTARKGMAQQQSANQSAMLFERQKYEEEKALRQQELQWRMAARRALFNRFGIEAPEMGTLGTIGGQRRPVNSFAPQGPAPSPQGGARPMAAPVEVPEAGYEDPEFAE